MKIDRSATIHYNLDDKEDAAHFSAAQNLHNTYNAIRDFKNALVNSIRVEVKQIDCELLNTIKTSEGKQEEVNPKAIELLDKAIDLVISRYTSIFLMNGVNI